MSGFLEPVSRFRTILVLKMSRLCFGTSQADHTLDLLFKYISSICEPLRDWRFKIAYTEERSNP